MLQNSLNVGYLGVKTMVAHLRGQAAGIAAQKSMNVRDISIKELRGNRVEMTFRENFQRMMRHDNPQWLPLDVTATAPVIDRIEQRLGTRNLTKAFNADIENICGFDELGTTFQQDAPRWRAAFAGMGVELPPRSEVGFAGLTFVAPPPESVGEAYHLREFFHPLAKVDSVRQLENLPWPNMGDQSLYVGVENQVQNIQRQGRVAAAWLECTVFEMAWYLRGMDNLIIDLYENNPIGNWLLDWFMQRSIYAGSAYAKAGMDVIGLGDDVGTQRGMMVSVEFWRTHFKPRLKKVIDAIRAHQKADLYIRYHSDGDIRDIIDDLIEVGVDILNPVQPECMDVDELVKKYQDRVGFWGILGTQTTMPFGTPDDIRTVIADCNRRVKEGAAIVLAPTHVLEPDVPWTNIEALVRADRKISQPDKCSMSNV